MRWEGRRTSGNVEDRRGMSRGVLIGGGGGLATLVVLAIAMFTGIDPRNGDHYAYLSHLIWGGGGAFRLTL